MKLHKLCVDYYTDVRVGFWMWIYFDCIPVVDIINHIGFFIGDLMEYIEKGRVE